jgi:fructose-1,6-bisphosphatase/inositol monophosphatase family enzyme
VPALVATFDMTSGYGTCAGRVPWEAEAMGAWDAELAIAMLLADVADRVSTSQFRSEELRRTHKTDGTPVSQIDFDVEEAMLAAVRVEHRDDHVIGEEIGERPGTTERRWIFDGIDGTHNYAQGRPGWATAIACEVEGEVVAAVVSAPRYGRRWWAARGAGAWTGEYADDGSFDVASGRAATCGEVTDLDAATVFVIPWEGFLLGWRDDVTRRFPPPSSPRSESIVLDAVRVASGEADVAVLILGSVWDYAGPSLIVSEAGGVFRDAWGGGRFDTQTAVLTNGDLVEPVLTALSTLRPPEPDKARLARTFSVPIGTPAEQALDPWRAFGLRPLPSMSARVHVENAPPEVLNIVDERAVELPRPLIGVTTDGEPQTGLRSLDDAPHVDTRPIADAAQAFLQALTAEQRRRTIHAIDAAEWRMWINVHMNHFRHGVLIEDLAPAVRELALDVVRATLSARGFHQARSIMRVNELLAELSGDYEAFGEWAYFMSVFGDPAGDAPWGWQIDGHHLCINAVVFDGRLVMTPAFMGAEPRRIRLGRLAGLSLFDPEEASGLELMRAFDTSQRERALIFPSILQDDISPQLQNLFDGRMQAGAFHDNLVAPYQGIPGVDMSDAQRRLLLEVAASYVGWRGEAHVPIGMSEVERHLDETWFSWYGGFDEHAPFYYRVHSPVIMIEFDHHPGVVLDNEEPTRFHVHSVVRTPNGGDYGADLLRQHHDRFDHRHGDHRPHR